MSLQNNKSLVVRLLESLLKYKIFFFNKIQLNKTNIYANQFLFPNIYRVLFNFLARTAEKKSGWIEFRKCVIFVCIFIFCIWRCKRIIASRKINIECDVLKKKQPREVGLFESHLTTQPHEIVIIVAQIWLVGRRIFTSIEYDILWSKCFMMP